MIELRYTETQAQFSFEAKRPTEIFHTFVPSAEDVPLAQLVSDWTTAAGSMLPKTPTEILELFHLGRSVLILNGDNTPMSHAAATAFYGDGSIEVGAVYTDENHRGKGAATKAVFELISKIKQDHFNRTIFAMGNDQSKGMFEKMGGRVMSCHELDAKVWSACSQCPLNSNQNGNNQPFRCCDIPYDLTNVGNAISQVTPLFRI